MTLSHLPYPSCYLSLSLDEYLKTELLPPNLNGKSLFSSASELIESIPFITELKEEVGGIILDTDGDEGLDFSTNQIIAFIEGAVKHATDYDTFVGWFKSWDRSCGAGMKKEFDGLPKYFVPNLSFDPMIHHSVLFLGNYATLECFKNMPDIRDNEGNLIGKGFRETPDDAIMPSNECITEALRNNPTYECESRDSSYLLGRDGRYGCH